MLAAPQYFLGEAREQLRVRSERGRRPEPQQSRWRCIGPSSYLGGDGVILVLENKSALAIIFIPIQLHD